MDVLKRRNMSINMEKTKIMIINKEESIEMEVDGIKLEQLKSFKYSEIQIQNNGKQDAEMNERISTAIKKYYTLNKKF